MELIREVSVGDEISSWDDIVISCLRMDMQLRDAMIEQLTYIVTTK